MRQDEKFEIERAFDLIPHVIGSSWAAIFFRLNNNTKPTREEYRQKVVDYMEMLAPLFDSYPKIGNFDEIREYIKRRKEEEIEKIIAGNNKEVEKRIDRYLDFG